MSRTFSTNRLLLTAKHTCWMLHIIIFHSQFVVQYPNKCLASLPKCGNRCLALLSKIFFCRFLQMLALHPRTYAFGSGPKCSTKCFALHPKYSQHKAWNPKCLGKSWTGGLFLHPKSLNKRVDSYPKWWNKWVAFANAFLHIQIVWTKPVVHPKRSNKCLCFVSKISEATPCFSSKVFEQMPWFASKMWANNFLRIQNVWTGAFSCTQHVWTKALLYNQHVRTNVLIRTSMFEQIPCFCFLFF